MKISRKCDDACSMLFVVFNKLLNANIVEFSIEFWQLNLIYLFSLLTKLL